MKKLFKIWAFICVVIAFCFVGVKIYADEENDAVDDTSEVVENENDPIVDADSDSGDPAIDNTGEEEIEASIKEKLQNYLTDIVGVSLAEKIISWIFDAGIGMGLVWVTLKYNKYKATTVESLFDLIKNKLNDALKDNFADLSKNEIKAIVDQVKALSGDIETISKILVLMQDSSTEGKVALIDFLGNKTKSEEIKAIAEETHAKLEEEIEIKKEVVEKVSGEYQDIF